LSASGAITGNPTGTNSAPTVFKVQDSTVPNQQIATKSLTITINAAPPPLAIKTPSPLPQAMENQSYSKALEGQDGTPPYNNWGVTPSLPSGLSLNSSTGLISGTPDPGTAGTASYTFSVQDSNSGSATKILTLKINPALTPLTITTGSLGSGKVGDAYSNTLTATGGTPPYSNWGVTPSLPSGLSLDPLTGLISGTPDPGTAGTASYTFSVQDSNSGSATKPLSLTINQ
jgi:hypothetical protein